MQPAPTDSPTGPLQSEDERWTSVHSRCFSAQNPKTIQDKPLHCSAPKCSRFHYNQSRDFREVEYAPEVPYLLPLKNLKDL